MCPLMIVNFSQSLAQESNTYFLSLTNYRGNISIYLSLLLVVLTTYPLQSMIFEEKGQTGGFIHFSSAYTVEAALSLLSAPTSNEIGQIFRKEITEIIGGDRGFAAVFWECPPWTSDTLSVSRFEFILLPTNDLMPPPVRLTEDVAFVEKLRVKDTELAVVFSNLDGDAVLVAPIPEDLSSSTYTHLKSFLNTAPKDKIDAFWSATANAYSQKVRSAAGKKIWLSTHGGGVPYLHARIDEKPKYYHYDLYKYR